MKVSSWWVVCGCSLLGCASVPSSEPAVPIDAQGKPVGATTTSAGLRVSGEELAELASRYFGVLEVTLENPTAEWIHIRRVTLDFGDSARNAAVSVPAGENLRAFLTATEQRNAVRQTNRETALAIAALGGALVGAASPERGVAAAGDAVALTSFAALAVDSRMGAVSAAEQVVMLPESHLLAGLIAVPPGLFVKRWIVLQTKETSGSSCLASVTLGLERAGAIRERVLLTFKRANERTEWQAAACHPAPTRPERHY
jgi:hypothetical protein